MTNNKKYQIFISYSTKNKDIKDKIVQDFTDYGFDIWVDTKNIALTKNWTEEIKKGISDSEILLYLGSSEAAKSTYVSYELGYADALNKIIFPIQIKGHKWSDCVPSWYSLTQRLELRGSSQYDKRKIKLFEEISSLLMNNIQSELEAKGLGISKLKKNSVDLLKHFLEERNYSNERYDDSLSSLIGGETDDITSERLGFAENLLSVAEIFIKWQLLSETSKYENDHTYYTEYDVHTFKLTKLGKSICGIL